ncbi:tRNA modification GTPase [Lentinula edodes]|uniref:tRNA modification GTPase n=1 Tax=Lentinula edodes TaxID=5353 RepID=A0A1Q3E4M9_LENED|nr:tRNA modification GTPase [Lentinula edodes]
MGKAGVAVIRISGPDALKVWKSIIKTAAQRLPDPWKFQRCKIVHPERQEVLDDGLAVFFKSPKSFTSEDVVELHIHSGRAIISSVLNALSALSFCRPAEAGEFTRRAFQGGRLDLTQVEGLKDLIDAETETQRRIALQAAGGASRAQFEHLRSEIIHCLAMVEALIDFGEGEDLEEGVFEQEPKHFSCTKQSRPTLKMVEGLAQFFSSAGGGNYIGGLPLIVADTAGLRATDDLVESIGIERAKSMVQASDLSLCVLSLPEIYESSYFHIPSSSKDLITPETCFLLNKSDLLQTQPSDIQIQSALGKNAWIASLETGHRTFEFLSSFTEMLKQRYDTSDAQGTTTPLITHARHRTHLTSASQFIASFLQYSSEDIVLGAEELRYAAQAVGKISGIIDVEDVLDAVFRDFCIGK